MQNKRILIGSLILLTIGGMVIFQNWQTKKDSLIKIVSSEPMRGVGQGMINGSLLALEEVGYKAGKFNIDFIPLDDGDEKGAWKPELEKKNAEQAIADPDVMVYMGTYNSGAAKISIPITNRAGLAQVSPGNAWPGLTKSGYTPGEPGIFYPTGKRTYFRNCPDDSTQGPAGAVWAKQLGIKTVYIVDDSDTYGEGVTFIFKTKATELGLKILAHKSIKADNLIGISSIVDDIKKQKPDLVYVGAVTTSGVIPFVINLREKGVTSKIMGPDGFMEKAFINGVGKDKAEGIYVTSAGLPPEQMDGKGKTFYDAYKKRFGSAPDIYAAYSYEAIQVILTAVERAGVKDRTKIVEELSKTQNFSGLFGTWGFDENGDTTLISAAGNIIENGEFKFISLINH
jgi:branched-chain amino acid transport system substrate-binding protein